MTCSLARVDALLQAHAEEASDGLVEKAPSQLSRGEGTEKEFFIFKIDLVGSTLLLMQRQKGTYLKLAHTFLSTVDRITQDYGADGSQVEYAGDGIFAYFPSYTGSAEAALHAAFYCHAAVGRMAYLEGALGRLALKCRIVLHFDTLVVAKIGPRAGSILSAIGQPLHRVAKLEKTINSGVGRVTKEFRAKLRVDHQQFLSPAYEESQELIPMLPALPVPRNAAFGLGSAYLPSSTNKLADLMRAPDPRIGLGLINKPAENLGLSLATTLRERVNPAPNFFARPMSPEVQAPTYRTVKTLVGYDIAWFRLQAVLK